MSVQTNVEIFGRSYLIKGEGDESTTRQIAEYVDRKMQEVSENSPNVSPSKVAILAALTIANELFQVREQNDTAATLLDSKASQLLSLLEKELSQS